MGNRKVIAISSESHLLWRDTGAVVLYDGSTSKPQILATSVGGCEALAEALKEMAEHMRKVKKQKVNQD